MTISKKIRQLAVIKKISVKELAELIEISEKGIHDILKRNDMKLSILQKISDALQVHIAYDPSENHKTPSKQE